MEEKYSIESINEIVKSNMKDIEKEIIQLYTSALGQLDEKEKENPITREALAISVAINCSNRIMSKTLYTLLNK